jgi:glutathione synthase/RimK-type ligase-like ATP-grasp enzyme
VAVVNNPFMWTADDKFFGAALITRLGVSSPRTVVLPNKEYVKGIVPSESLKNLEFPLDWEGIVRQVGLPCVLKDAHGGGWRDVYICHSLDELIRNYDQSGLLTMIVQQFIQFEQFVRCMCLGQEEILVMGYDPKARKYHAGENYLAPALKKRVVRDARTIVRALGYDMNSIEFAIQGGVPYAIDFMNPAPDMDIYSLTPPHFEWVVTHMADLVIRLAGGGRQQLEQVGWAQLFAASRRA